jgi:hypothetical protein
MSFRYRGLPLAPFAPLFALDDASLAEKGFKRMVVDEKPGFPCRITLEDAEPGERVLLVTYAHQEAHSPYKSSGAIFVRENAREAFDRVDEVPPVLRGRLLSLRAYDEAGMMLDAELVEGKEIETLLERFFASEATAYVHVHNARRGCFACAVERA